MAVDEARSAWRRTNCEMVSEYDGEETDALGYYLTGLGGDDKNLLSAGQSLTNELRATGSKG